MSTSTKRIKNKKNKKATKSNFVSPLTVAHIKEQQDDIDEINETEEDEDNDGFRHQREKKKSDANHERKRAKRMRLEEESQEEQRLTALLFGSHDSNNKYDVDEDNDDESHDGHGDGNIPSGSLFEIDRTAGVALDDIDKETENDDIHDNDEVSYNHDNDEESEENDDNDNIIENYNSSSAWVDEDDDNLTISLEKKADRLKKLRNTMNENIIDGKDYEQRLRTRFETTSSAIARTDWASVDHITQNEKDGGKISQADDEEETSASKILSSTKSLLASSSSRLQPHILNVIRCPDANQNNYNQSTVNSVHFHPGSDEDDPLMLTAGLDKTLRFFKISNGGESSQKIHGVNFPNMPIHSASFLADTGSVVVSGRRPFFYIYDTEAGKVDKIPRIMGRKEKALEKFTTSPDGSLIAFIGNDGYIVVVETKSKLWVADLKMNGSARAVSFTPDGKYILSSGSDGEVYRWDLRTKKCVERFQNQDGTITSYISSSSKFLAVGAESGVVNMYNDNYYADGISQSFTNQNYADRDPVKSIMNLQTSIDFMKFNTDGQILAMSSRREKDSLKLLHVPTKTVFSNWPTSKTPLGYVWSLDFSPGSKYMAIGNDKGKCLLYKVSHYHDK